VVADPRGLQLTWTGANAETLVSRLSDARDAVVKRAVGDLVRTGEAAVEPLRAFIAGNASAAARQQALWALSRIGGAPARAVVREATAASDEGFRISAVKIAGLSRDKSAMEPLLTILAAKESPLHLSRAAAEALGRIGDARAVPPLFRTLAAYPEDRFVEHTAIFALIEIGDAAAIAPFARGAEPVAVRNAALIALEQIPGASTLVPQEVLPLLAHEDAKLRDTANWIVGRHQEWARALAEFCAERFKTNSITPGEIRGFEPALARAAASAPVQEFLAHTFRDGSTAARGMALRVMTEAKLQTTPKEWEACVVQALEKGGENLPLALAVARELGSRKGGAPTLATGLLRIGRDRNHAAELRLGALAALPADALNSDSEVFGFLLAHIQPTQPAGIRSTATRIIAQSKWEPAQRELLADAMAQVGPLDAGKLLPVFGAAPTEALGQRLLSALSNSPALFSLQPQALSAVFAKFPASLQPQAEALLAKLSLDTAAQKQRLDTIVAELPEGDLRRGSEVFNSAKAACVVCHSMGFLGSKFGPDLTAVGQARSARDLLESIVFPSASFVRSFEPVTVRTNTGAEIYGILRSETDDAITLGLAPETNQRIPRSEVAEITPGTVSLMPPGIDQVLTRQELADLVAFLKATRWGAQ
jgi:putative heme-binding domain-containing protein